MLDGSATSALLSFCSWLQNTKPTQLTALIHSHLNSFNDNAIASDCRRQIGTAVRLKETLIYMNWCVTRADEITGGALALKPNKQQYRVIETIRVII